MRKALLGFRAHGFKLRVQGSGFRVDRCLLPVLGPEMRTEGQVSSV